MKRAYTAPPDDRRCIADRKRLKDGTGARCMKRRAVGSAYYCHLHRFKEIRAMAQEAK